jgi:Bacterial Ig-like domain (group 2)
MPEHMVSSRRARDTMHLLGVACVACVAWVIGCSNRQTTSPQGGPTGDPKPVVQRILITPKASEVGVGGTATFAAAPQDASGNAVIAAVTWRSQNTSIARVDSVGVVTAIAVGTAQIVATAQAIDDSAAIVVSAALPEVPRQLPDTHVVASSGKTIIVTADTSLQDAIDAALPGDVIVLDAGATFTGNFVLPVKAGADATHWVTIQSSALSQLPGAGVRTHSRFAQLMPKIVSPNADPAISTRPAASYYRFVGIEVTAAASQTLSYGLITLGDGGTVQSTLAAVPHHLAFDRVYVHGHSTLNMSRCFAFNSAWTSVINSYVAECHGKGFDAQAIAGWNGPGPFTIANNYLEASGENILFGGADPSIQNLSPSDITITKNHIFKPLSWRGVWTAKNLFELKHARRVLFEGNVLENSWPDAQTGSAILLQALSDNNTAAWTTVQDVTIRDNWIKNAGGGVAMASRVAYNTGNTTPLMPSQPSQRISFQNNLFEDIGADPNAARYLFLMTGDLQNVSVLHNTGFATNMVLVLDGDPQTGLVMEDNIMAHGNYGIFGSGYGEGNGAIQHYLLNAVIRRNVMFGGVSANMYPADNFFPSTVNDVGFVNWANGSGGDYTLSTSSPFRGKATDGTDPGVNMAALRAATNGVVQP